MQRTLFAWALLCAALLFTQGATFGHEQAIAFTELSFVTDEQDGDCVSDGCRIEIAHRLVIHDAESTLMNVLGARADLVGDREAQARLESYVAERFELLDPGNARINLTLLGGEVERGYYWVYQEGLLEPGQEVVTISQTVMMDVIAGQTNRVNVRYGGATETVVSASDQQSFLYRFK